MADTKTEVRTLAVTDAEAGQKLLNYLARRTGAPQAAIHKWVRSGQVRVDKARAKPFQRLHAGQRVRIPPHRAEETPVPPVPEPLPVVHEDEDILVVAKPTGLPTHGGTGHTDSLAARLKAMRPEAAFAPTPAHRLDKATSGLVAAGKSFAALRALQQAFASGKAAKTYLAWAAGVWPGHVNELTDRLAKTGAPGKEKVRATDAGKEAKALVRRLDARDTPVGPASLLALRLVTGRTHQLRVQLAGRGHPILGDTKYGGPAHRPMLLHAARLDLLPHGPLLTLPPDWPAPFAVDPGRIPLWDRPLPAA